MASDKEIEASASEEAKTTPSERKQEGKDSEAPAPEKAESSPSGHKRLRSRSVSAPPSPKRGRYVDASPRSRSRSRSHSKNRRDGRDRNRGRPHDRRGGRPRHRDRSPRRDRSRDGFRHKRGRHDNYTPNHVRVENRISSKYERPPSDDKAAMRAQVEFYFSEANLHQDKYLLGLTGGSENKPVPLKEITNFSRMRHFGPYTAIVAALEESNTIELIPDSEKGAELIKRKEPLPDEYSVEDTRKNVKTWNNKAHSRTAVISGFKEELPNHQEEVETWVKTLTEGVLSVRLNRYIDAKFSGSAFVTLNDEALLTPLLKQFEGGQEFLEDGSMITAKSKAQWDEFGRKRAEERRSREEKKAENEKAGDEKTGAKKAEDEETGEEKAGNEKAGDEKAGKEEPADEEAGNEKTEEEKATDGQAGDEKAEEEQVREGEKNEAKDE